MSENARCPQCRAEIPAGAPEGLCPQCLLQAALFTNPPANEQQTAPYSPGGSGFVPPTPEELQRAFPQLEILELLGRGGMGAVYKARQPGLDRLVAIKILPPEISKDPAFAERFTREARALAKLSHPNIVAVYDFGQTSFSARVDAPAGASTRALNGDEKQFCWFMMEYVDGINLRQAIRAGQLKPAEALKIVPQICDALQFAHDEGIVHRDIKPENVLLDKRGRVKIADFGLAKMLDRAALDVSLTGTQQIMGTLHYMAPEQFQGARDVDHRADIYSLGVLFYEMLTGELPIGRFAAPSKKVEIDVRLDEVVLRSLEQKPDQRYQHASEIKFEMESIARGPAPTPASTFSGSEGTPQILEEHPFLKGTRILMTPQPGMARWVGVPMLILCVLYVLASLVISILTGIFDGPQWILAMIPCGGGPLLIFIFLVLTFVWAFRRRNQTTEQALPEDLSVATPRPKPRVSFLWSVLLPAVGLIIGFVVVSTAAGVGLPFIMQPGGPNHAMEATQAFVLFGSLALVAAGIPLLLMIFIVRKLLEWHAADQSGAATRNWLIPALGVMNMIVACMSLVCIATDAVYPPEIPAGVNVDDQFRLMYKAWFFFDAIGNYFASALWFLGGLGLLLWKSWGRKLTIFAAAFVISMLILEIPATVMLGFRPMVEIWEQAPPEGQGIETLVVFCVVGVSLVVGFVISKVYHIAVLAYLTRPRVIAAFESEPEASATDRATHTVADASGSETR